MPCPTTSGRPSTRMGSIFDACLLLHGAREEGGTTGGLIDRRGGAGGRVGAWACGRMDEWMCWQDGRGGWFVA